MHCIPCFTGDVYQESDWYEPDEKGLVKKRNSFLPSFLIFFFFLLFSVRMTLGKEQHRSSAQCIQFHLTSSRKYITPWRFLVTSYYCLPRPEGYNTFILKEMITYAQHYHVSDQYNSFKMYRTGLWERYF